MKMLSSRLFLGNSSSSFHLPFTPGAKVELGLECAKLASYHGDNSFSSIFYRKNMRVTLQKYAVYFALHFYHAHPLVSSSAREGQ